jgi:hypothetical protein
VEAMKVLELTRGNGKVLVRVKYNEGIVIKGVNYTEDGEVICKFGDIKGKVIAERGGEREYALLRRAEKGKKLIFVKLFGNELWILTKDVSKNAIDIEGEVSELREKWAQVKSKGYSEEVYYSKLIRRAKGVECLIISNEKIERVFKEYPIITLPIKN